MSQVASAAAATIAGLQTTAGFRPRNRRCCKTARNHLILLPKPKKPAVKTGTDHPLAELIQGAN